jgi:hypothetical protein
MPPADPLAPVITALSYLAQPNPTITSPPQQPSQWTSGSNNATDGPLYTPAQLLLGLVLGASPDLTSLGNGINSALTSVASALANFAGNLGILGADETTAVNVIGEMQTALSLVQAFAPAASSGIVGSASTLFAQLQTVLKNLPIAQVAAELAELSQQFTAAAPLFLPD